MALEYALLFPLLLTLTFGGVQVAMWFQARNLCQAAAQAGVRAARTLDAAPGAGSSAASAYLARTAGDTLTGARTTETRTGTTVAVRCAGTALTVMPLPGLDLRVDQWAAAARERFTTP